MIFKRGERKADLDFAAGLILTMLLIAAVAVSCTRIFEETTRGRPAARLEKFAEAVKALQHKPAGSADMVLGYLGSRYAILGFSSTATRLQKSAVMYEGNSIREFFTAFIAERPSGSTCPYGKPCVCIVENPAVNIPETAELKVSLVSLTWENEKCTPLENADGKNDFYNVHVLPQEQSYFSERAPDYVKGGFIIARGENIGGNTELARGVGDFTLPNEPQIAIEKTEYGIAVCALQQTGQGCIREGMNEQQKLFAEAHALFREAQQAFEQGNYPVAEALFNELMLREARQKGRGFPGSLVEWQEKREQGKEEEYEQGKRREGVEFIFNTREHDALYLQRAESMARQRKYEEAIPALLLAQHYATQPATRHAARNQQEDIDCSLRSFAACATKEPRDACYRNTEEKACVQCARTTQCADFDHAEACVSYACGQQCEWDSERAACTGIADGAAEEEIS